MYTETAVFDLLLPGDARSLKQKRSYVRPILAMLKKYEVSAAEVGFHDLHGRAQLGVAAVAADVRSRHDLGRLQQLGGCS